MTSSPISSGAPKRELSYTCFPVKLFRLVSDEKYSSLWWDGCGSHFAVDVPRFELEILRNETIPEEDGFKTITFTSFVRQLNLYGFRKVAVNNKYHVDPRDLQRYAHPYFLNERADLLQEVKRQSSVPSYARREGKSRANELKRDNKALTQHFLCKGIRPSRKGPRPKYILVGESFKPMKSQKPKRRRKQAFYPSTACNSSCSQLPIKVGNEQAFIAYMLPTACPTNSCNVDLELLPQGCIWEPVQQGSNNPATNSLQQQGNGMQLPPNYINIIPQCVQTVQNNWQTLVSNILSVNIRMNESNVNSNRVFGGISISYSRANLLNLITGSRRRLIGTISSLPSQPFIRDVNTLSAMQPQFCGQQALMPAIKDQFVQKLTEEIKPSDKEPATTRDKNLNEAQSIAGTSVSKQCDFALHDDVCMTSSSAQYFSIDDVDYLKILSEESELHLNGSLLPDHVMFDCESLLVE